METSVDEKFVAFHLRRSFLCCEYGGALLCCQAIIHTRLQQGTLAMPLSWMFDKVFDA